jgi:glycosyltransferase involved in cell wall biosynthesis
MGENKPLVSIIVRTKDRPKLLSRAIKSISEQTYRPIEVVLVNDGGCDLDMEELRGDLGDVSLNYQRLEKNTGRAHAGNVGIEKAKGEYVGFLDDDDEFYPDHIDTLVGELSKGNYYKIAYSDSYLAFHEIQAAPDEYVLKKKERLYSEDFDRERFLFENYIPFMCLMFEKNVLAKWRFEEDLHTHEDWRMLTLISRNHEFLHLKKVTCQYNIYAASIENYLEKIGRAHV